MIVFTALTIGFTIVFVALHYRRTMQINLTQKRGIQQVVAVKQLISYIQQHRGLSSAWLNGDESKQANLTQLKKQISLLKNATASQISASVKSRWEAFDDHWQRLQNTQNKTTTPHPPANLSWKLAGGDLQQRIVPSSCCSLL